MLANAASEQEFRELMMNRPVRAEGNAFHYNAVDEVGRYHVAVDPAAPEHTTVYWAKPQNATGPWEFKVESRDAQFAPILEGLTIRNLRVHNRRLETWELEAIYNRERDQYDASFFRGYDLPVAEPLPDDEILAELEINNWPCGYEIH